MEKSLINEELMNVAIQERHSIRSYWEDRQIPLDIKGKLETCLSNANASDGLRLQLITDEPNAFSTSKLAKYGHFEGVRNYVAIVAPKGKDELAGYRGEELVLLAQHLGLNTCWVGLTYSKKSVKKIIRIDDGEELMALIAIGYGKGKGRNHSIKKPEDVCVNYGASPEWVREGVKAALLAPTALNQQKFRFHWLGESKVEVKKGLGFYTSIDLGIVKYHFEIGAAPHIVDWA